MIFLNINCNLDECMVLNANFLRYRYWKLLSVIPPENILILVQIFETRCTHLSISEQHLLQFIPECSSKYLKSCSLLDTVLSHTESTLYWEQAVCNTRPVIGASLSPISQDRVGEKETF